METAMAIEMMAMERLGVSQERLRKATTFEEAGIDSLAAIELVFAIEAHFGVLIDADDLDSVGSLQDLIAIVEKQLARGAFIDAA